MSLVNLRALAPDPERVHLFSDVWVDPSHIVEIEGPWMGVTADWVWEIQVTSLRGMTVRNVQLAYDGTWEDGDHFGRQWIGAIVEAANNG